MKRLIVTLALFLSVFALTAQDVLVQKWLVAGPFPALEPALSHIENVKGEKFKTSELLKMPILSIDQLVPKSGSSLAGTSLSWAEQVAGADSTLNISISGNGNRIGFVATYFETENFWKGQLAVESVVPFESYLGAGKVSDRYSASNDAKVVSKDIKLLPGKHTLIIKILVPDTLPTPSRLKVYLKPSEGFIAEDVSASTDPTQPKSLKHLLEGPKLSGVSISAAGDMAMISISELDTEKEKTQWFRKVIRIVDGKLVTSFRQSEVSQVQWMPTGNKLSYISGGNLWVYDLDKSTETEVLKGLNEISDYTWSPNEKFIIYSVQEKDDSKKGDVKRILNMADRQGYWRNRSFLYMAHLPSGIHERLTWGNRSTWLQDISPDSKNILFSISREDYSERPFNRQTLLRMDLTTRVTDTLWADKLFAVGVSYSPDGKKLLATGAPLAFGEVGVNVSDGKIPNGYDTQAYIYDIASGNVEPITRDFNPSISETWWCPITNNIYFNTVDEDKQNVYIYNTKTKKYSKLTLNEEIISSINFARGKQVAVYRGSGMNSWSKAYLLDLKTSKSTLLDDSERSTYNTVKFEPTKDWIFTSSQGVRVAGRYYLPYNFDPSRKYPTIVYYYGGTTPVGRDFGGRYPKELYAAHGFVVLVLQPSGAIGFGQEFSADHVNAWGIKTAEEIIEGTKKFAAEHSFVDSQKIGCIGASYGGFMTQYLLTQTDIFAAAISHAGISSISSYWGEGFWGYAYSAEASANSFPWNNKDLYINQSPLFSADKVVTPLLLLHGSDDTNVPVGESIQMFTALKLLGKPVELIQFDGEDHFILKYSRRVQWTNSILAWFTMYLKGEDAWWKELYPEKNY